MRDFSRETMMHAIFGDEFDKGPAPIRAAINDAEEVTDQTDPSVPLDPDSNVEIVSDESVVSSSEDSRKYVSFGRFRMNRVGLHYRHNDEDYNQVSGPIEVLAQTRSDNGENWGLLLRWHDDDGQFHKWAMPKLLLAGDGTDLRRALLDQGLFLAPGWDAKAKFFEYLGRVKVDARAQAVTRIGWHGERFVLPNQTFGDTPADRLLLQTEKKRDHAFNELGTLSEWQNTIATPAAEHSRLVFAISAALAAPLLNIVGGESGGFHLRGPSSIGKSTLLQVAGSVWGGGGVKGYLRQWRATDNGLEAIAETHCDVLLCLDELSQVDARAAASAAYMLANGAGKARAGRDGAGRRGAEWRTLFLSSGEIGLAEKVSEDGIHRKLTAGQQVRVVDIEADAGDGRGILEDGLDISSPADLIRGLQEATKQFYGTAGPTFLDAIIDQLDEVRSAVNGFEREFVENAGLSGADGQVFRVCERFALVAAAGELAIQLRVLPWKKDAAISAVKRCFEDWVSARGTTGPEEVAAAIRKIRKFIQEHGDSRFTPWDEPNARFGATYSRAGFRRPDGNGGTDFYVLSEIWKQEVCKGVDTKIVNRALAERGFLKTDTTGKVQYPAKLPGFSSTVRCYVLTARLFDDGGEVDA